MVRSLRRIPARQPRGALPMILAPFFLARFDMNAPMPTLPTVCTPATPRTGHYPLFRRVVLRQASAVVLGAWIAPLWTKAGAVAHAGEQREEPLADAVRTALHAAVSDLHAPLPVFTSADEQNRYWLWLRAASARLERRVPQPRARQELLQTLWYEARRAALEVSLVLGVMEVESGFRKFAISSAGARGLMQIMPFWVRLIGDGDESKLFHLQTNIRFGCVILRHYLEVERGNMFMALGRYNGSRGKSPYPNAVFAAQRKWKIHGF